MVYTTAEFVLRIDLITDNRVYIVLKSVVTFLMSFGSVLVWKEHLINCVSCFFLSLFISIISQTSIHRMQVCIKLERATLLMRQQYYSQIYSMQNDNIVLSDALTA